VNAPAHWRRRGPLALALLPLAVVFGCAAAIHRWLFRIGVLRVESLPVPVVVVGNITAGGTGKTPLVLWLVAELRRRGMHPGIVTRGYGGTGPEPAPVTATSDAALAGDEPVLLARRAACPVWRGRDRAAAGRALLAAHPECDVIVSDDGLQHHRLARAVEIAVVDATRGFGNGFLLPAGPLREPTSRLARCDIVVVKEPRAGAVDVPVDAIAMRFAPGRWRRVDDPTVTLDVAAFAGRRVHAVAGIGVPEQFFAAIAALGADVVPHAFPDHHAYVARDLAFPGDAPIAMTEKDAVKCAAFATARMWVLPVDAILDASIADRILQTLRTSHHGS
jgi:tetraacyldisaccharide 4'-kinase